MPPLQAPLYSYERIEEMPLRVIKKDGSRETYDRQKVVSGVMKACEKLTTPPASQ